MRVTLRPASCALAALLAASGAVCALSQQRPQLLPGPPDANNAAGVAADLAGNSKEAQQHFAKAIELASTPEAKMRAERAMAISYAFEGDCKNAGKYEQMVFDYYVSMKDANQQGEIADEAGRVCIDAGDLDASEKWYKTGHDAGLKEANLAQDKIDLWNFRWEHAQARLAARRGKKGEAARHVAAAKALLDKDAQLSTAQASFFPYLTGYVAFYEGDYKAALQDLQKANQNDAFIQCLIGQTYEKLGDKEKAMEFYRKAAAVKSHNPPAAYARRFTRKKLS